MLKTLRIRNLVTIDDLSVEFGPGLNVLTGETGAGKSIVVDALGLASGDRGDSALIRTGAERSVIEAAFDGVASGPLAQLLTERGLDAGDEILVVRRELSASGSGRVLVNGSPSTVAVLRELGESLVDLHNQHEHQGLLSPDRHLELLDAFGGNEAALAGVAAAFRDVAAAEARLTRLFDLEREGRVRVEALRETLREIRGVDPKPGELDALKRDRAILQNGARVAELLDEAIARLDEGEDPAIASLHAAERRVAELGGIDPLLAPLAARLESARLELEDARDTLSAYRDRLDFDPARLESIESRRAALERLLLKWGPAEDDAQGEAMRAERELATINNLDAELAEAERQRAAARAAYVAAARVLSKRRTDAAARLGPAVEAELKPLAFGKARFTVALTPSRGATAGSDATGVPFHPAGVERAEFFLAANPGEAARPIGRAASGGELSRLMLALHVVLDAAAPGRVLVFDEVDAGVSGSVAVAVGARLARLAARHQVLCVTHLPQVAAHAHGHYHVGKRVASGRTHTEIVPLTGEARVDELARMLGGRQATDASRENAAELLAEAAEVGRGRGRS
jgi:DNA repair protein RecN (Recombination protein N)